MYVEVGDINCLPDAYEPNSQPAPPSVIDFPFSSNELNLCPASTDQDAYQITVPAVVNITFIADPSLFFSVSALNNTQLQNLQHGSILSTFGAGTVVIFIGANSLLQTQGLEYTLSIECPNPPSDCNVYNTVTCTCETSAPTTGESPRTTSSQTGSITATQTGQATGQETGQATGQSTGQATGQSTGQATGQATGAQSTGQSTGKSTASQSTGKSTASQSTGKSTGTKGSTSQSTTSEIDNTAEASTINILGFTTFIFAISMLLLL